MQVNLFSGQDLSCTTPTSSLSFSNTPSTTTTTSQLFKSHVEEEQLEDSPEVASFLRLSSSVRENNNLCKDIFTFTSSNAQSEVFSLF